ncbi:Membrane-bound lytic murein transglycosylase D [Dyadobacter sp. CECT 9275]|uniref:Membrane-bound lytic murein transglycosylase D n=1 Tax=Dyadobacter helix TaxID=2822344 RepID=A0A916J8E8_9BACT|nr:lytic transglycosylase domain-containing protein [Dyadobacter sp. CECT 9275]CAG4990150.1 Membrane-bound lytic murein transglycosylase D [Dyadobacter sp. CECT 9275]
MKISKRVFWLGAMFAGMGNVWAVASIPLEQGKWEQDTLGIAAAADEIALAYLPDVEEIGNTPSIPEPLLRERFARLEKSIPLNYNKSSHEFVEYFIYKKANFTRTMMEKMPLYFPLFEKTLQKYGLPQELKYLSMIESGLNPRAISRARAGGLWQFMSATGREFGLQQNGYIDERFEPVKATDAACRYLTQLHNIFGDWELALASYNTGPGNVKRAMRRSRGTTFWTIYNVLPKETRSYVPQFVAMNYMMNYGHDHGIYPENPEYLVPSDTIHINGYIDLEAFCTNSGIDFEELNKLNPQITKTILPDNTQGFVLKVPSVKYTYLVANRSSIMDSCTRRLLPGQVMLARTDSASTDSVLAATGKLYANTEEEDEEPETASRVRSKRTTHTVRRGETLQSIASKNRVEVAQLKKWNRLRSSRIRKGQHLVLYKQVREKVPVKNAVASTYGSATEAPVKSHKKIKMRYHTVQHGDTLWTISQRYGLPLSDLKRANRIRGNEIKPGMKLLISG